MDTLNPLDLPGPQFLLAFGVLALVAFVLSAILRTRAGAPSTDTAGAINLDPYEVAHLAGGDQLALNTALASLYRRDLIAVDHDAGKIRLRPGQTAPFDLHPVERVAFGAIERAGAADATGVSVAVKGSRPSAPSTNDCARSACGSAAASTPHTASVRRCRSWR